MARFADALVQDADLARAAEQATAQALAGLDGPPTLVFVFVSGDDPDAVAAAGTRVAQLAAPATVIGCSAGGVLGAGAAAEDASAVSVLAGAVPELHVRSFHLEVMHTSDGMAVVGMPNHRDDDAVMVLFADPFSFPADGFIERSNVAFDGLPLVGGLATGAQGRGSTRLFIDGHAVDRGAVGLLLGGPINVRAFVSQGCRPIGPTMVVTAAEDNAVLELAGMPALLKLEQIISGLDPFDQALASSGLQFGIAMDEYAEEHEHGDFLIRSVVTVDHERQAVVVGGIVEVGRTVRFQVRDADTADDDLRHTLKAFADEVSIDGALLVSCNGRGAQLFAGADHDVLAVREHLGHPGVAGFFAAGEIGPVAGRNFLHGFTASVLAFAR